MADQGPPALKKDTTVVFIAKKEHFGTAIRLHVPESATTYVKHCRFTNEDNENETKKKGTNQEVIKALEQGIESDKYKQAKTRVFFLDFSACNKPSLVNEVFLSKRVQQIVTHIDLPDVCTFIFATDPKVLPRSLTCYYNQMIDFREAIGNETPAATQTQQQ